MKKNIVLPICLITILSLVVSLLMPHCIKRESPTVVSAKKGFVYINGIKCTNVYVEFFEEYSHVSLIDLLNQLNFVFHWQNENELLILGENKNYTLNLENKSLIEHGKTFNLLEVPPGCRYYYCIVNNKTLLIDTDTLQIAMSFLGKNLTFDIDSQNHILSITDGKQKDGSSAS